MKNSKILIGIVIVAIIMAFIFFLRGKSSPPVHKSEIKSSKGVLIARVELQDAIQPPSGLQGIQGTVLADVMERPIVSGNELEDYIKSLLEQGSQNAHILDAGEVTLNTYKTHAVDYAEDEYAGRRAYYIQTHQGFLVIHADVPYGCEEWSPKDSPTKWRLYDSTTLKSCHDYFAVYSAGLAKTFATLEVPDYFDPGN